MVTVDGPIAVEGPARGRPRSSTHVAQLSRTLNEARRRPAGLTRAEIAGLLSIGRNAVEQRLQTAVGLGLLISAGHGTSTGGRAPQVWTFNPSVGTVLVACISIRSSVIALTDLGGTAIARQTQPRGMLDSPDEVCAAIAEGVSELRALHPELPEPWGLGVTLPIPVDVRDGRVVDPVALSRGESNPWTKFPIRRFFSSRLGVSVWVEDEVNAMALTAAARPGAPKDLLYVRLGLGLGLGIVSGSKVHRGVVGTSGELAHIQVDTASQRMCRCGRRGCLETFVSGTAFEDVARRPESWSRSPFLTAARESRGEIFMEDVFHGISEGDTTCVKIAADGATRLAGVLAVLATTYNPGEIVIGGTVTESGGLFATFLDRLIRRRVLATTSSRLSVRMGGRNRTDEISGATRLVVDALLSPPLLSQWIDVGRPGADSRLTNQQLQYI